MRSVLSSASSSQNRSVHRQVPVVLLYLLSFFSTLPEPGGKTDCLASAPSSSTMVMR